MGTIINNVISPAVSACWTWFNNFWYAIPGALGFFLAIFTFGCVIRFLVLPILGGGFVTATKEERQKRAQGSKAKKQKGGKK